MMTNTQALQAILARVGTFTGMPKANIQIANNPQAGGKPFEPPKKRDLGKSHSEECGNFYCKYW